MSDDVTAGRAEGPDRIGRFAVLRKLGEGGMGVVYAARDERLARDVAVKVLRAAEADRAATERLLREARSAAAFNHPSFCQIFEIGEDGGRPFLVMELLVGRSLTSRLAEGPLFTSEAARLGLDLLAALEVLHAQGLIHRDLKPSNIFLTPHGIKLLDFGLARPVAIGDETLAGLTLPGMLMGSPHYMSPEQARGAAVDTRSDLFALGVLLFEMIAGRQPFTGGSVVEVLHAVIQENPPALTGSPGIVGLDRIIHKALAKSPAHRYASAREMAAELRDVAALLDSTEVARPVTVIRLAVLPFRLLKPDDEVSYLTYGLADAITSSLAGFQSLVVRSSLATARYGAGPALEVRQVASELDVDLLLTGTLLRSGDRLRASVELIEAPAGKTAWSQVAQVSLGDVFELQDSLARRIVSSLPLTAADRLRVGARDVPRDQHAYEAFLRANHYALESSTWRLAREQYQRCLALDPSFAPAWAGLGRIHRVLGKYSFAETWAEALAESEAALSRALALNPDLSGAHFYYAQLEADMGKAEDGMVRLLRRARGGRAEPEILAGLLHTCRYCGLLGASLAAYDLAVRLDPAIRTSVLYTYFALGDYERALEESAPSFDTMDCVILSAMGRWDEARAAAVREEERYSSHENARLFYSAMRAALEGRTDDARRLAARLSKSRVTDGEAIYFVARVMARTGDDESALEMLGQAVAMGFFCTPLFARDPWLSSVRTHARFPGVMATALARHEAATACFHEEGGPSVLGVATPLRS